MGDMERWVNWNEIWGGSQRETGLLVGRAMAPTTASPITT